jgi:hypothetical protein
MARGPPSTRAEGEREKTTRTKESKMKHDTNGAAKNVDDVFHDSALTSVEPAKRPRKPGLRKAVSPPDAGPIYYTTAEAARILRVTDDALRKRVEREERKVDGTIAFTLGRNAVVACKFGSHWRYQISPR